jgi:hypothetical protein
MPLFNEFGVEIPAGAISIRSLGVPGAEALTGGVTQGVIGGAGDVLGSATGGAAGSELLAGLGGPAVTFGASPFFSTLGGALSEALGLVPRPTVESTTNPVVLAAARAGVEIPTAGGVPSRSGGALDAAAVTNFLNSMLGISPAGAGELPKVDLSGVPVQGGIQPVDPALQAQINQINQVGSPSSGRIEGPSRVRLLSGDAVSGAPGASAASVGANPNVPAEATRSLAGNTFPEILDSTIPAGAVSDAGPTIRGPGASGDLNLNPSKPLDEILTAAKPTSLAPPKDAGGLSNFWKEYGPLLGVGAGAAGLAYGLANRKDAQADQQQTASLLNRVAGTNQSAVIDPTSGALADYSLLANSGLASSQDFTRANPLLDIFQTGKLPPALQAKYDQALIDANAASASRLANMGIGNSTMFDTLKSSNLLQNLAAQGTQYQDLFKLGLASQKQGYDITSDMVRNLLMGTQGQTGSLTQAGGIYNAIAKDQIAADKDLTDAIAKLATAMGKSSGLTGTA